MDNRPEFISAALAEWAEAHSIKLGIIETDTPTQNSYIERFNRIYRDEILNMYVFRALNEVRELTEGWVGEHNEERPHDSLSDLTPWGYPAKHEELQRSHQVTEALFLQVYVFHRGLQNISKLNVTVISLSCRFSTRNNGQ